MNVMWFGALGNVLWCAGSVGRPGTPRRSSCEVGWLDRRGFGVVLTLGRQLSSAVPRGVSATKQIVAAMEPYLAPSCPGNCLKLEFNETACVTTDGGGQLFAGAPCSRPDVAIFKSRWKLAAGSRFSLQLVPGQLLPGGQQCFRATDDDLGSTIGLHECLPPEEGFIWVDLGGGAVGLRDVSGWCVDSSLRLAPCELGTAAVWSPSCVTCPCKALPPRSWVVIGLLSLVIIVLPFAVAAWTRGCARRRQTTQDQPAEAAPWPRRSRLAGASGILAPFGWLLVVAGILPLALWVVADAWPGHTGWYLILVAPGAALLSLMVRPSDAPHIVPAVLCCAIMLFGISALLVGVLTVRWVGNLRTSGSEFGVLAVRDANVLLLSLASLVCVCRYAAPPNLRSAKGKALAWARFVRLVRIDAALFGVIWMVEAVVRMAMWPALQLHNPHLWCNFSVGVSTVLTAACLRPAWVLRLQTMPSLRCQLRRVRLVRVPRGAASDGRSGGAVVSSSAVSPKLDDHVLAPSPTGCPFPLQTAAAWNAAGAEHVYPSAVKLGDVLGRGGFGTVYAAVDGAGTRCAVKLLGMMSLQNPVAVRRMRRELLVGCELRHPNLCATLGLTSVGRWPGLVLELCDGGALSEYIFTRAGASAPPRGPLPDGADVAILADAAAGLAYLHSQNISHRDFKPENVLLQRAPRGTAAAAAADGEDGADGEGPFCAKICDFGLSTRHDIETSLSMGSVGTARYIAPEALFSAFKLSADVYSCSMVMYAVLHRAPPFDGMSGYSVLSMVTFQLMRPEVALRPELAPYATLMAACWDADANARPTMSAVAEQLAKLVGSCAAA